MSRTILKPEQIEYKRIAAKIELQQKYEITSIMRIDDPILDERYLHCKKMLTVKRGKEPTEVMAFHGCSFQSAAQIIENGFNRDFNTCGAYGKGTYFSTTSEISLGYAFKGTKNKLGYLVVSYILLGTAGTAGNNQQINLETMDCSVHNNIICLPIDEAANPKYLIQIREKLKV